MGDRPSTEEIGAENMSSADFGPASETKPKIKGIGLPPPTEFINTNHLIRDEREVLSEVGKEKSRVSWKAKQLIETTSSQVKSAGSALADGSIDLLQQSSETLKDLASRGSPFWKRFLAAFGRGIVAFLALVAAGVAWLRQKLDEAKAAPLDQSIGLVRMLESACTLYARPDEDALVVGELKAGVQILTFPELEEQTVPYDASKGRWTVARAEDGSIGFLRLEHLQDQNAK